MLEKTRGGEITRGLYWMTGGIRDSRRGGKGKRLKESREGREKALTGGKG